MGVKRGKLLPQLLRQQLHVCFPPPHKRPLSSQWLATRPTSASACIAQVVHTVHQAAAGTTPDIRRYTLSPPATAPPPVPQTDHLPARTPSRVLCTGKQPTNKQKSEIESSAPKDVTERRKRQRRGISKQEIPLSRGRYRVLVRPEEQKTAPPPEPPFSAGCWYANSNPCGAFS